MKYLSLLIIGGFVLQSCEHCERKSGTFENKLGQAIIVTSYKNYNPDIPFGTLSKIHTIQNNDNIMKVTNACNDDGQSIVGIGNVLEGDSIVIDFGNKKIGYGVKNLTSNRNPYFLARQEPFPSNFVYTVTVADYINAP